MISTPVKPLLTVLIPVYNCAKWVCKTLESVLSQSYRNFEVIIVDDCSSDNTLDVVKQYTKNDSRVKIFTNDQNLGIGAVRKILVSKVTTPFFFFIDDDDHLYPKVFQKMMALASDQTDLVVSKFKVSKIIHKMRFTVPMVAQDYRTPASPMDWYCHKGSYLWGTIFRTTFIRSLNEHIWSDLRIYEDIFTFSEIFANAKTIAFCNIYSIRYLRRPGSLSSYASVSSVEANLDAFSVVMPKLFDIIQNSIQDPRFKRTMLDSKFTDYFSIFCLVYPTMKKNKKLDSFYQRMNFLKEIIQKYNTKIIYKVKWTSYLLRLSHPKFFKLLGLN
ncbi:glycosyltransferase family 2 protein [[Mycoplasma] testudinis]|uniref:glycosyltransferase family 2 protein n=1 Tax=[Mycoplasma] testudinis TaxID=33924 RepID=UPI000489C156|nr:glycosyltransferase family 2 protein [[Mycoplasma] testudinis]